MKILISGILTFVFFLLATPMVVTRVTDNPPGCSTFRERVKTGGGENKGEATREQERVIRVDGVQRRYLLHLPPDGSSENPLPLVFVFHGGHGKPERMAKLTDMSSLADQENFMVVYPASLTTNWNDGRETTSDLADDVGFIQALLEDLSRRYPVDGRRVYATGISNGGNFSLRLAVDLSDKIAAVASVAANMPMALAQKANKGRPISVMFIVGTSDPLVPFAGGETKRGFGRQGSGKGLGGEILSNRDSIKYWVAHNQCSASGVFENMADTTPDDGTRVSLERYTDGRKGTEVVAYIVEGGGHTWPSGIQYMPVRFIGRTSRDINASKLIWRFFSQHPLGD